MILDVDPVVLVQRAVADAFARGDLRPDGGRVLVACSGGPDSSALLDALAQLAPRLALELAVASIDHGLRPAAVDEVRAVLAAAAALGLPAAGLRLTRPPGSMAAARRARYDALAAHARAVGAAAIAVGHTATDQAETLLDRMLRGAGTRALGGMAPRRPIALGLTLIRPLLGVTAVEIEAYVAARGLAVARDPTNVDPRYRRSRLRHQVLPLLRAERGDADRALAELCERLRADGEALDAEAARLAPTLRDAAGTLDVAGLAVLAPTLRGRVLRAEAGVPLERVHLDAIARLCDERAGTRTLDLPMGLHAERRYGRLRLGPAVPDPGDLAVVVRGPGQYPFLDEEVEISDAAWAAFGAGELCLRNPRPGDRIAGRRVKLKEVLIDRRVPRPDRRRLPLLARARAGAPDEVVWIRDLMPSPGVRALTRKSAVQ
jgi:tRNA(Ile)-lysidine synthase